MTADGYVFRTDLRLRPDPGSTPVAVSIASAEHYYQTLGQNWERAAFIKARAAAGDRAGGRAFLASLEPFIWRKHLDFAAVEDVHSIKRQILSAHKSAELGDPVFDVKLGRGGIRDIELFAQTQQLILGGRNRKLRALRARSPRSALWPQRAPIARGRARGAARGLRIFPRRRASHADAGGRAHPPRARRPGSARARRGAGRASRRSRRSMRRCVEQRRIVAEIDHQLFGREESLADPLGSLIFTGVEDNPETLATIARLGFADPRRRQPDHTRLAPWPHPRHALRARARIADPADAEIAARVRQRGRSRPGVRAFRGVLLANLSAGVQVLSLLEARPALLDLLARLLTRGAARCRSNWRAGRPCSMR